MNPDDAAVFGKCIIALKALDGAKLSKDAAGVDRANTGHGGQYLVLRGIKPLYDPLDGAIDGLKLFFKGADAVEGTADGDRQWLVKALVQPVGVLCSLLQQISSLLRIGDPPTAFGADESYQIIHGRVHDTALIGYIYYEAPANEQNFSTLVEMINAMEVREDDESFKNAVDLLFDALEQKDPDHFALRQYKK